MTPSELAYQVQVNVTLMLCESGANPRPYRVLARAKDAELVWLKPLDRPPDRLDCVVVGREQLSRQLRAIVPMQEDVLQEPMPVMSLTEATARRFRKNQAIVAMLTTRLQELFTADGVNREVFAEIARAMKVTPLTAADDRPPQALVESQATPSAPLLGVSVDAVTRISARWFHCGRTEASQVPRFHKIGGKNLEKFPRENGKPGRPSLAVQSGLISREDDHRPTQAVDRENIKDLVEEVIIKRGGSIDNAAQEWHNTHNIVKVVDADGCEQEIALPRNATLSDRTVRHWISEYLKKRGMHRRRVGDAAHNRKHRPRVDRRNQFDLGAGMITTIDETPITDIDVVSRIDDGTVLGTMRFYGAVDAVTTMGCGAFMSLRPPSQLCVAQTLLNVILPKRPVLADFGLREFNWEAEGDYATAQVDWGPDFSGHAAIELVGRTRITWTNVPRGRPDLKPSAESLMATIQKWPKWFRRAQARNAHRPPRPRLNQRELALALLLAILERNSSIVPTKFLDSAAIEDGLREPSRAEYHRWTRARFGWAMPLRHPNDVRLSLLARHAGRISDRGINFRGLYFNLPRDLGAEYLIRKSRRKRPAICIIWNDDLVSDTWAYNLHTGERMQLSVLHAFQRFDGLSWPEMRALQIEIAIAHGWATPKWRDERAAIDAAREKAGLSALGGKRLTAAQPLLLAESLPSTMLTEIREGTLSYEGERDGLDELCEETAISSWTYTE